jgi:hypothetical protein
VLLAFELLVHFGWLYINKVYSCGLWSERLVFLSLEMVYSGESGVGVERKTSVFGPFLVGR